MERVKLVDICRPKQWKTISTSEFSESGYPIYGANGKIGFYHEYTHEFPTVLITCRGATCGTINISEPKSYVNGNAMALDKLHENYSLKYLYYILQARGLNDVISGSAQPQITREGLLKVLIPNPPLETQKHIAQILDDASALRDKTKQLLKEYDTLAQSIYLEMFGDLNSKKWEIVELNELCYKITDGTHQGPKFINDGIPFLLVSNIVDNKIEYSTNKFISEADYKILIKSTKIEIGDILYTSVGSYGNPAIVKDERKFCFQRHIAHLKPIHSKINVVFLHAMMAAPIVKRQADLYSVGAAQKTLNLKVIKKFNVILPPIELQNQFAEKITLIEQQKELAKQELKETEDLFNCLLQKAFKGELLKKTKNKP